MPFDNYLNYLIISFFMSKRITIVLSDTTNKKTRRIQSKFISESPISISFSKIIEILILEGLDHIKTDNLIKRLETVPIATLIKELQKAK